MTGYASIGSFRQPGDLGEAHGFPPPPRDGFSFLGDDPPRVFRTRRLFVDQYAALILLYFFNPILTSLRGLQQASGLDKVQRRLGGQATSLGALSEAARVLDAAALQEVITELAGRVPPPVTPAEQ